MKALSGVVTVACLGLAIWGCSGATPVPTPGDHAAPRLGTLWYLSFGFDPETGECRGGLDSTIWNSPGQTVFYPEYGLYCAGDPGYIAWALRKMQEAGINMVLLSWNGWGDTDFGGDVNSAHFQAVDEAVGRVFEHVRREVPDLRLAVLVEPFRPAGRAPGDVTVEEKQRLLDYLWERYYSVYPEQVFRMDGKPVVVTWKPPDSEWRLDDTGDQRFAFKHWGDPGEADWVLLPREGVDGMRVNTDGTIMLLPRWDNFYLWLTGALPEDLTYGELTRVDPRLDEGFYDKAWRKVFEDRERVTSLVLVYAWNAYAESAFLEPAYEGPYPPGDTLLRKTRWYYDRLVAAKDYRLYPGP